MGHTDVHVEEKVEVRVGERPAASPVPAGGVGSWGKRVGEYVPGYFHCFPHLLSVPSVPVSSMPFTAS